MRNRQQQQQHSFNVGDTVIFKGIERVISAKLNLPKFYLIEDELGFVLSKIETMSYDLDENKKYLVVIEDDLTIIN